MEKIIDAMKEKSYEIQKIRKKEEIFTIDTTDITEPESSGENQINRNTNWKLTFILLFQVWTVEKDQEATDGLQIGFPSNMEPFFVKTDIFSNKFAI